MSFKKRLTIHQLRIVAATHGPTVPVCFISGRNPGQPAPSTTEMAEMPPIGWEHPKSTALRHFFNKKAHGELFEHPY